MLFALRVLTARIVSFIYTFTSETAETTSIRVLIVIISTITLFYNLQTVFGLSLLYTHTQNFPYDISLFYRITQPVILHDFSSILLSFSLTVITLTTVPKYPLVTQ